MSEETKMGLFGLASGIAIGFIIGYAVARKMTAPILEPSSDDDSHSASGRKSLRHGKTITAKDDIALWASATTQRGKVGILPKGGDIVFLTYEPNGWGKFRTIHYKDNQGNIVSTPRFVYINRVD